MTESSSGAAQCAACSQCQSGCHMHESQERERLRRLYEAAVARAEKVEDREEVLVGALRALRTRADFWARDTGRALPAECDAADEVLAAREMP